MRGTRAGASGPRASPFSGPDITATALAAPAFARRRPIERSRMPLPTRSLAILFQGSITEHHARAPAMPICPSPRGVGTGSIGNHANNRDAHRGLPQRGGHRDVAGRWPAPNDEQRHQDDCHQCRAGEAGSLDIDRHGWAAPAALPPLMVASTGWPETMRREFFGCRTERDRHAWAEKWARFLDGTVHRDELAAERQRADRQRPQPRHG